MGTIIGLNGLKGSGKDTAGVYFVEEYGYERISFAADLKRSAAAVLGIPADDGEAFFEALKNNPDARLRLTVIERDGDGEAITEHTLVDISVREYLQFYGTEGHRDIFGQDFWTRIIMEALDPDKNYVITDSRFVNECTAVRNAGGTIIEIVRAGTDDGDGHASEEPLPRDLVDTVLYNNGTIEALYDAIDSYVAIKKRAKWARVETVNAPA